MLFSQGSAVNIPLLFIPSSFLVAAGGFVLLPMGISSSFMGMFSDREQQEPDFCLSHLTAVFSPRRQGGTLRGSFHPQSKGNLQPS